MFKSRTRFISWMTDSASKLLVVFILHVNRSERGLMRSKPGPKELVEGGVVGGLGELSPVPTFDCLKKQKKEYFYAGWFVAFHIMQNKLGSSLL